jgi:hypothetical protein
MKTRGVHAQNIIHLGIHVKTPPVTQFYVNSIVKVLTSYKAIALFAACTG